MGDIDPGDLPRPPRVPRPLPEPAAAGWWVSPGFDPRVLRYHDGDTWSAAICRVGLRGPGPIEQSPLPEHNDDEPADPEIAALPKPPRFPWAIDLDNPKAGWWSDPDHGILKMKTMRYYDGRHWTDFVCELGLGGPGVIERKPRPSGRR